MSEEYPSLRIEGGLISAEVLADIKEEKTPGQRSIDFSGDKDKKLLDLVSAAWGDAQERWLIFQRQIGRLSEGDVGTTITRAWMSDLLSLLGFDIVRLQHLIEQDGRKYHLSHRAGTDPNAPPVHIVGCRQSIDRRAESGPSPMAPHSMVQDFLNHSEELWGIVTNGMLFRLLRDSHLMKRQAYIEFDLEEIFTGERFPDFYLLFRLAHASRFPKGTADTESCLLEQYHRLSIEQGGRVRNGLRNGVEQALLLLANGFLTYQGNAVFAKAAAEGKIDAGELYRQLLKVIYRLLFLMVCEERGLISSDPVYKQQYSINRLRRLIHHRGAYTKHTDLWTGLVIQFQLFSDEELGSAMNVPPLNGELFSEKGTSLINNLLITNDSLLNAMWNLAMYKEEVLKGKKSVEGPVRRVNYAALDVEELGSVYESLLDLQPVFLPSISGVTEFKFSTGTERKSTGSFYTPPELVNELIKSALVPVIEDRLGGKKNSAEKEAALLSLSVCDPACGSGHFLLAAARRIGRELAKVRSGDEEPSPEANRDAIRDVITHCIYGVDKNPLAVDLCRVALWLEGHTTGKPLTFLDHRIRCGDSLVGVRDLNTLKKGIPPEAYKALTGDDKDVAKKYVALAKDHFKATPSSSEQEKKKLEKRAKGSALVNQPLFDTSVLSQSGAEFLPQRDLVHLVAERKDLTVEDKDIKTVRCKAERFEQSRKPGTIYDYDVRACNIWTAAFFAELTRNKESVGEIPTNVTLQSALSRRSGEITESQDPIEYAQELAEINRFFHWPIEYPEVFSKGGFDCVIGNPPWKKPKLQQKVFFQIFDPIIATTKKKSDRDKLISKLPENNPELFLKYQRALHNSESISLFLRESQVYPLAGRGDVNYYAVFSELCRKIINNCGRSGIILPIGIATDDTTKFFFQDIILKKSLVSLIGLTNWAMIFPMIGDRESFCLFTVTGSKGNIENPDYAFHIHFYSELEEKDRYFTLTPEELELLNPNTLTSPVFRSKIDAEIAKGVYKRVPILINEKTGKNHWNISTQSIIHMSNDSHLFQHEPGADGIPLFEGKMFWFYNHRYGYYTVEMRESDQDTFRNLPRPTDDQLSDPSYSTEPRYYISLKEVKTRIDSKWKYNWILAFRSITLAVNERTGIFSILPIVAVGNSATIIYPYDVNISLISCLFANFSSIIYDFFVRQKVGGNNYNLFIFKQMPVLPPEKYTNKDIHYILPRVFELVYCCWEMKDFSNDLWIELDANIKQSIRKNWYLNHKKLGDNSNIDLSDPMNISMEIGFSPFIWDEERRMELQSDLDAFFAKLYGLNRNELEFILDPSTELGEDYPSETFRVMKNYEIEKFGEYRTRRLVLEAWERMES